MTNRKHSFKLLVLWLLLSLVLCAFLFSTSWSTLKEGVRGVVQEHLLLTLDEAHFSRANNRLSDSEALDNMGRQINNSLQGLIESRSYSPWKACELQLQRIDDVELVIATEKEPELTLRLPRNQIERQVDIGLECTPDWRVAVGTSLVFGAPFLLLGLLLPPPLSRGHRYWINYLLERGCSGQEAFELVSTYGASDLDMNVAQRETVRQLHSQPGQEFQQVLDIALDPGVAALTPDQVPWLVLGLGAYQGQIEKALQFAAGKDQLTVDLMIPQVRVRGLEVPMGRTPLFYYAWYCLERLQGDGWVCNPASNRPDHDSGKALASMMADHGGHARAINDLSQNGLKARTLDQNRSKLKEELAAVLGEELAAAYLFEANKHQDGMQMQYRLRLDPAQIEVIKGVIERT